MINKKMYNGGKVSNWTCLNFSGLDTRMVNEYCKHLGDMCNSKGVGFNPNPLFPIRTVIPAQIEKALADVASQASRLNKHLQLLIIVLPDFTGTYGLWKEHCLCDAISKSIPLLTDMPTIIFGADVTHSPPGEDSAPSTAAVVASMDWPEVTKYRSLVSAQGPREEMIKDLYKVGNDPKRGVVHSGMIRELLIAFRKSTGYVSNIQP